MAAIRKRGNVYQVRWRRLDGIQTSRTAPTLRSARELELSVREAHARGVEWEPPAARARTRLVDVAQAYQDARRLRVAPHTLRVEGGHLDLFLRFAKEQRIAYLDELSRAVIDRFLEWCMRPETARHGRARKPGSAGRVVEAAVLLWQWATNSERWEDCPRAPYSVDLPRATPAPVVAPTWAEMDACIAQLGGWQRKLAIWLRYTGLRAGESMLFRWEHIDMQAGTLTIPPDLDKNKVGRLVPLAPLLLDVIAGWGKRDGYVIPSKRSPGPREREPRPRDFARAWKRAGVRAAVWERHPEHALRRGFKSGLLRMNANADAVDYLQGHTLGAGSRGRYIDPWALPLRETVAMVPAIGAGAGNVVPLASRGQGVDK